MGDDNWTICPRCTERTGREIAAREQAATDAYGKVPVEEWKSLDNAARLIPAPEYQFREDYEIGVEGSDLSISYSGCCQVCGLTVSFKRREPIEGIET